MASKIEKMVVCDHCHQPFTAGNPGFFVQGEISACASSTHYFEPSAEPAKILPNHKSLLCPGNSGIDLCCDCLKRALKFPEVDMYKSGYDAAIREINESSARDRVGGGR